MNVGIVGLGLIGGSLAKALAEKCSIRGWDSLPGVRDRAMSEGFEIAPPEALAAWADIVVVAVPPGDTIDTVWGLLRAGAKTVLDTASTKEEICQAIESDNFLGAHPLAGGTATGWRNARGDILHGATWALVAESAREEVFLRAAALLDLLDSPWVAVRPAEHDRILARSSHLVQLLHVVLAAMASDWSPLARRLSGPALRDTTRLADSNFNMWQEIIASNEENIAAVLFAFAEELRSAQLAVLHPDADMRTLWRHGSLGRGQIMSARWQEPVWRESSLPRGNWWEELLRQSGEGALFRRPRFDTGLLLLERA